MLIDCKYNIGTLRKWGVWEIESDDPIHLGMRRVGIHREMLQ